jgi:transposase
MIHAGFLSPAERAALVALLRDGSATHRLTRRANAVLLLDDGLSCEEAAKVLYLDDDTVRGWAKRYGEGGVKALTRFESGGSASHLTSAQEETLKAWIAATLPRSTREVGAHVEKEFGVGVLAAGAGLIALPDLLGLEYHKPEAIGRKLDPKKQQAFIAAYENLLNSLDPDEAVLFVDAVHPTHAARPVGCWAPAKEKLAIEQTSGRQRLNIHGAVDLETGKTAMLDVETVDAASTIRLLEAIEAMYPMLVMIHVFLDNALPPRQARADVAGAAGAAHHAALRSGLLPAFEPDRAAVGRHAQASDAQQVLRHTSRIRRGGAHLPARKSPQMLAGIL